MSRNTSSVQTLSHLTVSLSTTHFIILHHQAADKDTRGDEGPFRSDKVQWGGQLFPSLLLIGIILLQFQQQQAYSVRITRKVMMSSCRLSHPSFSLHLDECNNLPKRLCCLVLRQRWTPPAEPSTPPHYRIYLRQSCCRQFINTLGLLICALSWYVERLAAQGGKGAVEKVVKLSWEERKFLAWCVLKEWLKRNATFFLWPTNRTTHPSKIRTGQVVCGVSIT